MAQTELISQRETWWDGFTRVEDKKIINKLLGKGVKVDTKKDAFAFRELLRRKKNTFLKTMAGMNFEELKKPENLGWFETTKYAKRVSIYDIYSYGKSYFVTREEASDVERLLEKFETSVESIATDYINNDEVIYGGLGDWMWNNIRGFLLSLAGKTFPAGFLSATTAFGYPIGAVGLAAMTGTIVGYWAYNLASSLVVWGYTGDTTAFQDFKNNSAWIVYKTVHLALLPVLWTKLSGFFGNLSFLFNSLGMAATLFFTLAVPQFGYVLTGLQGLGILAVNKTANIVATANKDLLFLAIDPRTAAVKRTYMEDNEAILEELERIRLEFIGRARIDATAAHDMAALTLSVKTNQKNSDNASRKLLITESVRLQIEGYKEEIATLRLEGEKKVKKIMRLKGRSRLTIQNGKPLSQSQSKVMTIGWQGNVPNTVASQPGDVHYVPAPSSSIYDTEPPTVTSQLGTGTARLISEREWVEGGGPVPPPVTTELDEEDL